ncbi:DUF2141 domain-containing protein [Novosphingobium bradum]|uniref:DUF2141 domain-containing protein n=1 Tax=Novosphingobium bradum TaxID=1737444 RepID=A0ABV7IW55_9SPHN
MNAARAFGWAVVAIAGLVASGPAGAGPADGRLPGEHLSVTVSGLHSARGQVLACIASAPAHFPECGKDPGARRLAIPVGPGGTVSFDFGPLAPGRYAVSLFHDENANGKLDTMLMIPREGFGFSRDARVHFGPPRFDAAAFAMSAAPLHLAIRMRYLMGSPARQR